MSKNKIIFDFPTFSQLTDIESSFLKILATMYIPVAATPLAICGHRIGIDDPNTGLSFNMNSIRPHLNKMVDLGWVILEKNRYCCHQDLQDPILKYMIEQGDFEPVAKQVVEAFPPREEMGELSWSSIDHGIAHARLYMYLGQHEKLEEVLHSLEVRYADSEPESIINTIGFFQGMFGVPADTELLALLDKKTFLFVCKELAQAGLSELDDIRNLWSLMSERVDENTAEVFEQGKNNGLREFYSLLSGRKDIFGAAPKNENTAKVYWYIANSVRQLIKKRSDQEDELPLNISACMAQYEQGITLYHQLNDIKKQTVFLGIDLEKFYLLALIAKGETENLDKAKQFLTQAEADIDYALFSAYSNALISGLFHFSLEPDQLEENTFTLLFYAIITFWLSQSLSNNVLKIIEKQYQNTNKKGYAWLAAEYATALARLSDDKDKQHQYQQIAQQQHAELDTITLFDLVKPQAEWERTLNALNRLSMTPDTTVDEERIIWILDQNDEGSYFIKPKIQKKAASGVWTKGRNVALKRLLKERHEFPQLTQQDRVICDCILEQKNYDSYYSETPQFYMDMNTAWLAMVGHPCIYWSQARGTALEITKSEFELVVSEEGDELRISFYPPFKEGKNKGDNDSHYLIHKETPTRLCIYRKNEQIYRLSEILSDGLVIPRDAEKNLRETLASLAPMVNIQSDLEGISKATKVIADSTLHANLLPYSEGLRATLRIQAFGSFGPLYPPGAGRAKLLVEHNGVAYQTQRDLELEQQKLDNLIIETNVLGEVGVYKDEYLLEDPQDCLELLEHLRDQGDDVLIAWPEGEVMRVSTRLDNSNMRLSINKSGDWFQLDGHIETDKGLVLSLRKLLELSEKTTGRFIELGEGEYISLTNQFRKKLSAVHKYTEMYGEGARLSGIAAYALDDFFEDVGTLTVDDEWQQHVYRLKELENTVIEVPSTLATDLRDYQEEGFRWLTRLAAWGVGACLADDMGLGKTIQTLALLLHRAEGGAALIVAPTSVCYNWESEIQKFAPTLTPLMYRGNEREVLVDDAKQHDLVIVTYGLLQQDNELFLRRKWHTIVLDEAQAIKNVNAKRTRIAHQLEGDFKLVTTGTPIENHLGELWSLFRFLNSGLLGSQEHFMKHYMTPIERNNDAETRDHLKRLIQPFILRRLKTEVLDELPPKTEITLNISLSGKERAMYEAVRQKALQNLSNKGKQEKNTNHLKVLAAITKLRLASCHPKLIIPDSTLASSKLERFAELVNELRDNDHKALVFSQFVKHLDIIKNYLDSKGITYQYLDGSTPAGKRKQQVEDFQNGKAELFLISLKAGGSGLNLTAADYVIHMDPWWNPAVEDQASDRAHRIGQKRPVTIYRLVAENTIEEKIVKLHQHKRDLADSLLEGSNMSGSMKASDMLRLIQEG